MQGQPAAYRREIATDPANGTIFRLVFRTELEPNEALDNAGMVVEFGPVDWGTRPISAR